MALLTTYSVPRFKLYKAEFHLHQKESLHAIAPCSIRFWAAVCKIKNKKTKTYSRTMIQYIHNPLLTSISL